MNKYVIFATDDYVQSEGQRTVRVNGQDVTLIDVNKVNKWFKNLRDLPNIEPCDVMIYLMKMCGWEEERLKHYKNDNGYKLHLANLVSNVEMAAIPDIPYTYVKSACIPETRQNEAPYQTWVCLSNSGTVHSGGCTCVA